MAMKFGLFLLKFQITSCCLFFYGIEQFLGCQFTMTPSTKRCSYIFDLGPSCPKFTPQNLHKTRPVRQTDRRCLGLPGGFRGWPIQWNHTKCCGADPCCHGNEIWTRQSPTGLLMCVCCVSWTMKGKWLTVWQRRVLLTALCARNSSRCVHILITYLVIYEINDNDDGLNVLSKMFIFLGFYIFITF